MDKTIHNGMKMLIDDLRLFFGGNFTPLKNCIHAAIIQCIITFLLLLIDSSIAIGIGAGASIGFFYGKEQAQNDFFEFKLTHFWTWDYSSKMNVYCPLASTVIIALLFLVFK